MPVSGHKGTKLGTDSGFRLLPSSDRSELAPVHLGPALKSISLCPRMVVAGSDPLVLCIALR